MSDATLSHDPAPFSGEDLPPHRAAIPVPPAILLEDRLTRRRKTVSITVVFSLALHVGFLSAAALWGQGEPLPDADIFTAAIRVQIAQAHPGETIIPKGSEAAGPAPIMIETQPLTEAPSAPPQAAATAWPSASPRDAAASESPDAAAAAALPAAPELPHADAPSDLAFSPDHAGAAVASATLHETNAADSPSDAASQPMPPAQDALTQDIAASSEQVAPVPQPQDLAAAEQSSTQDDAPAPEEPETLPDPAPVAAWDSPAPADMAAAHPDPATGADSEVQDTSPTAELAQDDEPGEEQGEALPTHLAAAMALIQETPQPDIEAAPQQTEAAAMPRHPEERLAALLDLGSPADDAAPATGAAKQNRAIPAEDGYKPPQMRSNRRANVQTARVHNDGFSRPQARSATRRVSLFGYKRRIRAQVKRYLPVGIWGPGRVVVGFRLSRSGGLLAAAVLRSSGNALIDQAALSCVRNAGPYPAPPVGSASDQLALSIDFRFQ